MEHFTPTEVSEWLFIVLLAAHTVATTIKIIKDSFKD
jgi:hypothetical protein